MNLPTDIDALPPITGRQLRAARQLALLSRFDLAESAGISEGTVADHEQQGERAIRCSLETRIRLINALKMAGVVFGPHEGVERLP